ncbi:uncharacterized protein LOC108043716 [Drosophila rhopaloa]|uniref:Uncharacterized protein n=1 Tax=Drosophila rhopaloa TaxID=1041015 RepID=A0ABM5HC87_DRORH|nr:uncharacterized protein LOC108043716 [Drosophila rhopaloa]
MSTRRHFGIVLLLCSMSLSSNYRLLESQHDHNSCPARNKDTIFEEPHLSDQHRNFYNVHEIPRRPLPNPIKNEIKSENWLLRIINIKNVEQKPSQEPENQRMEGFFKRFLNILSSYNHKSEPKLLFILKKNRNPTETHVVKNEPEQYNIM